MYIYAVIIIHNGRFRFLSSMCRLNKGSIFIITETQFAIQGQVMKQPNCTERLHVDATIMRPFQTEQCMPATLI